MQIKICCDNGANVHSERCQEVESEELSDTWEQLSQDEQYELARKWVLENWIEIWIAGDIGSLTPH